MARLSTYIKQNVDPVEYYDREFDGAIRWPGGSSNGRVKCCFHNDSTPSLHFDPKSGEFYCHGCGASGRSIISFHAQAYNITPQCAAAEIFKRHVRPIISSKEYKAWHEALINTPPVLCYVAKERFISAQQIKHHWIGYDGRRITLPIFNEWGLCVNVRRYLPQAHNTPKMLNFKREGEERTFGSPELYPYSSFAQAEQENFIVITEGEWDALALISLGIPAITSTHGCKTWPSQYNERFRGLEVIIAYDNDEDGQKYEVKPIEALTSVAKVIKRLDVPQGIGKDITDWIAARLPMRQKAAWLKRIKSARVILKNDLETISKVNHRVPLAQASHAKYMDKRLTTEAIITGKWSAPFTVPKKYRVSCSQQCDGCPLAMEGQEFRDVELDVTTPDVLELLNVSKSVRDRILILRSGVSTKPTCKSKVQVLQGANVEQLILTPTLETSTGQFVARRAYFVGHGLRTNRAYAFTGVTTPHPADQETTHVFYEAMPIQDEIDTFILSNDNAKELMAFQPRNESRGLMAHLNTIAEWQSRHVTKIHMRSDLHIAVDLVFHSVPSFEFNGEYIPRGMLDVVCIGDTRCGKGYVFERLVRYYGLGEIASGENCTFAGLVGGCQQIGKQWLVTWGMLPLNHNRLVIIDEASDLTTDEIGHMSRVRSEGVAEISKIVREQTPANTRLLWFANPRSGREISSYNYGVWAVKELMGNNEDISRIDFALTVANNEVPSDVINAPADYDLSDVGRFSQHAARKLILWAWSRKANQVKFSKAATLQAIKEAIKLGDCYSSVIPLVQVENVRVKLAKISAAIAARCFSTDGTYEQVIVKTAHVQAAVAFLNELYSKPSMAYDAFSRTNIHTTTITAQEDADIELAFSELEEYKHSAIEGMLRMPVLTADGLCDYLNGDMLTAKGFMSKLVVLQCIERSSRGVYHKSTAFSHWLRNQRKGKVRNDGITEYTQSIDGEIRS